MRCPSPSHRALSRLPPPTLLTPDPFAVDGDRGPIAFARRVTCSHRGPEHEATHSIGGQRFQPSAPRRPRRALTPDRTRSRATGADAPGRGGYVVSAAW